MLTPRVAKNLSSYEAEEIVSSALQRQGWRILARNFRQHGFELDIVAAKADTLVFLEVKARTFTPRHAVDFEILLPHRKKMALKRGGEFYAIRYGNNLKGVKTMRFDLALVLHKEGRPKIEYFVDVLA